MVFGGLIKLNGETMVLSIVQKVLVTAFCICMVSTAYAAPRFKVVVIAEFDASDQHYPMVQAAKTWFAKLATDSTITVDWVTNPDNFTDAYLANYKVVVQLNYPPFAWNATSQTAFQKYMEQGKAGWIGFHHAALYSQDVLGAGQSLFTWFKPFLGGITYKDYVASRCAGTVAVEDTVHPCMKNVSKSFIVTDDEWYTWDKSPRPNVHVLATVNELSYNPSTTVKMNGDHPVVWSNENAAYKGRNIYIFMGHSAQLFTNTSWMTLVRNSIFWTAGLSTGIKAGKVLKPGLAALPDVNVRTDRQFIVVHTPGTGSVTVNLTDVSGAVVARANGVNGTCRIDSAGLRAGMYLLCVKNGTGTMTRRLVL
jgi:type 1 glutamine amidotransferase